MRDAMRAVIIDPFEKTVKALEWEGKGDGGELAKIKSLLEADDVNMVAIADHGAVGTDVIWVDGEGLFKPGQRYFKLADYPQPLAGKGVVLGVSRSGDTVPTLVDETWLKSVISWVRPDLQFVRLDTVHDVENHPRMGRMNVTRITPIFKTADGTLIKDWEE